MKKIISTLLSLVLFSAYGVPVPVRASFSDLDYEDPSGEAIEALQDAGVLQGYEDGTFRSTSTINRAEFLKIVVEAVTDNPTGSNCFSDVTTDWYAKYVCYAKDQGYISGYDDGTFKPANEINFAEASKVLVNVFGLETGATATPWYRPYVESLSTQEAIPFSIGGLDKEIMRGEMAEVIWRLDENKTDLDSLSYEELAGNPVSINSCDEMEELFLSEPYENMIYYDMEEDSTGSSSGETAVPESEASDDYSSTNVQVADVDEPDIVKNDGEYIYSIKDSSVRIVQAYPADTMTEVAAIDFSDSSFYPTKLALDGDRLIVLGSSSVYSIYEFGFDMEIAPEFHASRTAVHIYDVSDPSNPDLVRELDFDGDLNSARTVGDTLYMVLNKYDFYYYYYDPATIHAEEVLPRYYDSSDGEEKLLADCTDIRYLPRERDLNYLITLAIPLQDEGAVDSEVLVGSSENIYASTENLYVASTNYDSSDYYYDWSNAKTLVHRFALDAGSVTYESSGEVPGTILNQFSMDEADDHFRIATTRGSVWDTEVPSTNNLYILDQNLNTVGSLEGIAPGETIYSTRFIGDRGYMVTFKKIDPLFVFDLSNPEAPQVLGQLKIPGYSTYLHPYDETHILGFGKDAEDGSEEEIAVRDLDFAWYQGMKVALFDISDVANPEQLYSVGIGDRGTESELLYDHKALLFSAAKNLLAFPVSVAEVTDENASADTYGETVFQGAYIYNLNLEDGFTLKGAVTHYEDTESQSYWDFYDYYREIRRVIYIGDTLYTISDGFIKALDLDTLEELSTLELAD